MLEIKKLSVEGKNNKKLLKKIDFSVRPGEYIGLTGSSGAGKTTLIKAIMGILDYNCRIVNGSIMLDGTALTDLSAKERRELCGITMGFIPQNPMTAFDRHKKIGKLMEETYRIRLGIPRREADELAAETLRAVNLTDVSRVKASYPGQLSGGMLQRVTVAILWGLKPRYILADEPTSALDEKNRDILLELLKENPEKAGIVFLSHDAKALKMLCKQIMVMENGALVERQTVEELFRHPVNEWTKKFIISANMEEGGEWIWKELKYPM
ncbi:peptide/nickel transport system ATP-binding protein/nickel transport system ATP-binding protein [Ruminiclostridium sufflavum DSM 19573]|uniref:Peptide/nickel transport system ATP-binding protein/nickel transport system ATP-binding protein n=1 Tax=Ruminiclostridium sufflavum DSM 19573 TaxID=1121337 RepID=A0A318XPI0_9FIRM|nr:ATP-binding cassette domain-containing protein [Ruminiclostridium sufflavum]PYG90256.1 peptide/nickel transport system ATP-binding protein/nickel transport system ATP-binding protein [Ruminiclostridium sufflavum DSM 19573]